MSDLSVLILTYELFHHILCPVLLRKGNERMACWVSGSQPRFIHHNIYLENIFAKANLSLEILLFLGPCGINTVRKREASPEGRSERLNSAPEPQAVPCCQCITRSSIASPAAPSCFHDTIMALVQVPAELSSETISGRLN